MCNKCLKRSFSPPSHCRQVHVFKYSSGFSPPAGSISFQLSCVCGNPAHTSSTPRCLMSMCCRLKQNGQNLSAQGACSPVGTDQRTSEGSLHRLCCAKAGVSREIPCVFSEAELGALAARRCGAAGRQLLCRAVMGAGVDSAARCRPVGTLHCSPSCSQDDSASRSSWQRPTWKSFFSNVGADFSRGKADEKDFYQTEKHRSWGHFCPCSLKPVWLAWTLWCEGGEQHQKQFSRFE